MRGWRTRHPKRYFAGTLAPDLDLKRVGEHGRERAGRVADRADAQAAGPGSCGRTRLGAAQAPRLVATGSSGTRRRSQPGWFTGPARDSEPRVMRELEAALERVADEVDRKAAARG